MCDRGRAFHGMSSLSPVVFSFSLAAAAFPE